MCCCNRRSELGTFDSAPAKPVEDWQIFAAIFFGDLGCLRNAKSTGESQTGEVGQFVSWQRGVDDNAVSLDPAMLKRQAFVKYCDPLDIIGVLVLWQAVPSKNCIRAGGKKDP